MKKSDWEDVVEGCKEFGVARSLSSIPRPYTKKDADWFINQCLGEIRRKKRDKYTFAIILKKENKLIGTTGLFSMKEKSKSCITGPWINKKYWRKGYIIEAKIPVLDFIFNDLNLERIETTAMVDNIAPNEMSKKIGFEYEGTKRKSTY